MFIFYIVRLKKKKYCFGISTETQVHTSIEELKNAFILLYCYCQQHVYVRQTKSKDLRIQSIMNKMQSHWLQLESF